MIQSFLYASIVSANSNLKGDIVLLNKQDNGKEINVRIGEIIRIELERYGSTGYEWYPDKSYGEYLELIREGTEAVKNSPIKGTVGIPVRKWWELKAVKKGETEISIYLYRYWERKDKAVDSFKIKVKIS
jgi:predicted secreted protein